MTTLTSLKSRRTLTEVLLAELSDREGRGAAVARIAVGCTITAAVAMVFEIPQPNYMVYIVFAISKDEKSSTITAAVGGLVAVTFAIVLTLGLSLVDTAEPALRLPLMALATFVAMFTSRTFALGPLSYLAGFVMVMLQSLVDDVRTTEALSHVILWMWVIVAVPVAVTVVVNVLFGQAAETLVARTVRKVLEELANSLPQEDLSRRLPDWRSRIAPLLEHARHASRTAPGSVQITAPMIRLLLDALVILEALPEQLPGSQRETMAMGVRECITALTLLNASLPRSSLIDEALVLEQQSPTLMAFLGALESFRKEIDKPESPSTTPTPAPKHAFVADAFTNPVYWQFALKTTIAVMISYAVYTMLDWPGLRTSIVTCFFVALSSLGETVHKLILRISGAAIGGITAGLCIVFLLPHLTDIGQLCLLIAAVSLCAAWVATSSEILAYGGMQIAFAFFLGILQGYAPANDLTVLRDRLAGILLGNIVITLVFSSIWPESANSGLRAATAEALNAIAALLRPTARGDDAKTRTARALIRADHLSALRAFEIQMLPRHVALSRTIPEIRDIRRLAGTAFVARSEPLYRELSPASLEKLATWAGLAADSVAQNIPLALDTKVGSATLQDGPSGLTSRLSQRALSQLRTEVQHVAATML